MIRWPGRTAAGSECDEPVVTMDLFATIAATVPDAGESISANNQDGVSLLPLLTDPHARLADRALFFHYPHYYRTTSPVGAARKGDWKLVEFFEEMRVELYNLQNDLGEKIDLASQRPEQTARLRDELHQWRDALNAQMPTRNSNAER